MLEAPVSLEKEQEAKFAALRDRVRERPWELTDILKSGNEEEYGLPRQPADVRNINNTKTHESVVARTVYYAALHLNINGEGSIVYSTLLREWLGVNQQTAASVLRDVIMEYELPLKMADSQQGAAMGRERRKALGVSETPTGRRVSIR